MGSRAGHEPRSWIYGESGQLHYGGSFGDVNIF